MRRRSYDSVSCASNPDKLLLLAKAKYTLQYSNGIFIDDGLIILVHQRPKPLILTHVLQVLVLPDLQHADALAAKTQLLLAKKRH